MTKKPVPRAKQFGKYLKQYRQKAGLSQRQVADKLGRRAQSYIAMLESDDRKPPRQDELNRLIDILSLSPFEAQTLRLAADGALDIVGSYSIPLDKQLIGKDTLKYHLIWIIGLAPIEFFEEQPAPVYDAVLNNIIHGETKYVYWIPSRLVNKFNELLKRLQKDLNDLGLNESRAAGSLECITSPEILCIHQFAIYNPLYEDEREGRLGIQGDDDRGTIEQVIRISKSYTRRICKILEPVYDALIIKKEFTLGEIKFERSYP